jgi:hypothetical protein
LVIEQTFGVKARELSEEEWLDFYAKYMYLKGIDSQIITKGILEAANLILKNLHEHR